MHQKEGTDLHTPNISRHRRALITGVGGPSGIAALKILKENNFYVVATDMRQTECIADSFYQVPAALASEYIEKLFSIIEHEKIDWLFPTVSEELVPVSVHAHLFREKNVAVFIPQPSATRICDDKWLTATHLAEHGVAIPESALGAADDPMVQDLGFPCVSRPRVGRGGRGVVVHERAGLKPATKEVIWQTYMPGKEYDVLLVIDPDTHDTLAMQVFEKTELREQNVGNAITVKAVEDKDIGQLAVEAVRAIGLTGPADIDIRRDVNGEPKILEINARIGAHSGLAPQIFDALITLYENGSLG